jgi:hypothetical protein
MTIYFHSKGHECLYPPNGTLVNTYNIVLGTSQHWMWT